MKHPNDKDEILETDGVPFTPEQRFAHFDFLTWKYKVDRVQEYPPIGDQLDALFKAGVFPADMAAAIQAVKDKYPKGTA